MPPARRRPRTASGAALRLRREVLDLPSDLQQLLVLLPDDEETARAVGRLREGSGRGRLRAIS
ncbi:hypothetical protein ABZ690_03000 [Streptomyces sp. NPDC006967]|uniref:hypothetical protein n=1 Tax=unclassified Streptomyces TaxID=2593676 RepID=UPI001CA5D1AD|nr:hypothetical protein [Streptomyces sp. SM1]